jgi:hypothetical protein
MWAKHRFTLCLLLPLLVALLLWTTSRLTVPQFDLRATMCSSLAPSSYDAHQLLKLPQRRKNIAVVSGFGFHFDVYLPLVSSLEQAMEDGGSVHVYAPSPFAFGFQKLVDQLGLYHGNVEDPDNFLHDLAGSHSIDMVIMGTCEVEYVLPLKKIFFPSSG